MNDKYTIPLSKEAVIFTRPEPDESSPQCPNLFLYIRLCIIFSHFRLGLSGGFFLSAFYKKVYAL
jgi:hypothetical protein